MILEELKEIVSVQFNVEIGSLTEATSFEYDLNADSIDLAHLVMTLEDEYGIEVDDDDIEHITTIGEAIEYIEEHIE